MSLLTINVPNISWLATIGHLMLKGWIGVWWSLFFSVGIASLIDTIRNQRYVSSDYDWLIIRRFYMTFLNDIPFKIFLLKSEVIDKFGLNNHKHLVQPPVAYFEAFFLNNQYLKNSSFRGEGISTGGILAPHAQKLCIILLLLL